MIVIDCSILISGTATDETSVVADQIFDKLGSLELEAIVPSIFFLEAANVLVSNFRRQRIVKADIENYIKIITNLPITQDANGVMKDIIKLAVEHSLSAYDASYLELAKRMQCPLATLDKKLHKIAQNSGIAYGR